MFCRKCGYKLGDDEMFCPSCGTKRSSAGSNAPKSGNERIGLLFDEREPSYNNVTNVPRAEETIAEQETEFAPPEPVIPQASDAQPVQVQPDMPYVMPDTSGLITDTEFLRASAEPSAAEPTVVIPSETGISEDATVMAGSVDDLTALAASEEETVIAPMDDSYNVYSGAVPGVSSQDFRYPTNDNAYPDLPTSIAPQFDDMAQQFDEDATVGMDYTRPAAVNQQFENRQAALPQDYMQQGYGNYAENYPYPPQTDYNQLPEEPKKKNTAMWIIIACISVIIIALGATCAVILTQYGSFEDFFASFSESKDDEDDDGVEDEKKGKDKDKGEKESTERETETAEPETEATTIEITTLPPTTEQPFDGYCGAQVYYDYDEASRTLVISGTGEMQNYANTVTPWAGKEVRRVEVGEGVTSVTPGAFTEIVPDVIYLSSTVTSFDVLAVNKFGGIEVSPSNKQYKSVNEVLFDKSGTILIAYPNQKINTSYAIPEGVKIIDELAFYEATNLNSLSISSTVEYIDNYAFKGCVNIHRLDMPVNVAEIRSGVFYGWLESQEIYIANAETKVVGDWNEGCSAEITVLT